MATQAVAAPLPPLPPAVPAAPAAPAPLLGRGQRAHHPVRILSDGTVRTFERDQTIFEFRRYLSDMRHPLARVVMLAREMMEVLELVGNNFPEINKQMLYELGMNARLQNHLVQADPSISSPAQILRDGVLYAGVRRRHLRHRDRHGLPNRPKTQLTRGEHQAARRLRDRLRQRIPFRQRPATLGKPAGETTYHIAGRWVQNDPEIWMHKKGDELREAAQIDPDHANDFLAIEDATEQGVGCNMFKVLTRAQLLRQKGLSLPGLPRDTFDQWNAAVALRYP